MGLDVIIVSHWLSDNCSV